MSPSFNSLEQLLLAPSTDNLQPISQLTKLVLSAEHPQIIFKGIYSLYRVWVVHCNKLFVVNSASDDAKAQKTRLWPQFNAYVSLLMDLLDNDEPALREGALKISFSLLKHASKEINKKSSTGKVEICQSLFRRIVEGLMAQAKEVVLRDVLKNYLDKYEDIRWFFLREVGTLMGKSESRSSRIVGRAVTVLTGMQHFPQTSEAFRDREFWVEDFQAVVVPSDDVEAAEDDWRKFFDAESSSTATPTATKKGRLHTLPLQAHVNALNSHRAVLTRCWITILPLVARYQTAEDDLELRILHSLHLVVLPHLHNDRQLLVMDWVSSCVSAGGTKGLVALNSLWSLMRGWGVSYPNFYDHLPTFLTRDLLHSKYRARFFRLMELFLSSTHIPASILPPIIHRLAVLSLHAPPGAVAAILPFIWNLMRKHPVLLKMIHEDGPVASLVATAEAENPDPEGHTLQLHPLFSHRSHYHPPIPSLLMVFEQPIRGAAFNMEDFLDLGYGPLLETALGVVPNKRKDGEAETRKKRRKITKEPVVRDASLDGRGEEDVVGELWGFPLHS